MLPEKTAIRTTLFSMAGNLGLAIIKGLAGFFGNSFALIADAIESTSDVFASIIVLLGFKYSSKPADKNHPYGHGKIEPLVTFILVAFLLGSAGLIAHESISNIRSNQEAPEPWTLIVLALIILWKEISYQLVLRKSIQTKSTALKAEAWHHRSDAITSVMAFIGIGIAVLFGKGYEAADDWAALFASTIIVYNSYKIFRPALAEIMDEHIYDELTNEIVMASSGVQGILGIEKCYIRKAGMKYQIDLHAIVDGNISVSKGHELSHELEDCLRKKFTNFSHILIHIEPDDEHRLNKKL